MLRARDADRLTDYYNIDALAKTTQCIYYISLVHEVQKRQKERQKDRTDKTSASTQITVKNMHVTDSKNIRSLNNRHSSNKAAVCICS